MHRLNWQGLIDMNIDKVRARFDEWTKTHEYDHVAVDVEIDLDQGLVQVWNAAYQQATKDSEAEIELLNKQKKQILDRYVWPEYFEKNPNFETFIRAFWRRIEPYKNDYDKELPERLPPEFKAHMATAFLALKLPPALKEAANE